MHLRSSKQISPTCGGFLVVNAGQTYWQVSNQPWCRKSLKTRCCHGSTAPITRVKRTQDTAEHIDTSNT